MKKKVYAMYRLNSFKRMQELLSRDFFETIMRDIKEMILSGYEDKDIQQELLELHSIYIYPKLLDTISDKLFNKKEQK